MLVYLAVSPNGATSDELMAALWPETRPRYARGRFHTTMSELRHHMQETLDADAIVRTDERYKLDPAQIDVDLWHLNALAVLTHPGFVRAAPTRPGTFRTRLPSAPIRPLRRPDGGGLPPPLKQQRLTAHETRPQRLRPRLRRTPVRRPQVDP